MGGKYLQAALQRLGRGGFCRRETGRFQSSDGLQVPGLRGSYGHG